MKVVIKSVGHINPDPQNLLKAFEENREKILTPDMREHIQTLRQTCKHLGIQGRAFSDAWLPDHVLWILIETMRPHLETEIRAKIAQEIRDEQVGINWAATFRNGLNHAAQIAEGTS